MRHFKSVFIVFILLLLLPACSTEVPAPPEPPDLPDVSIKRDPIDLKPAPIFINKQIYYFNPGTVCLRVSENYGNTASYFPVKVSIMLTDALSALGYQVLSSDQGTCDIMMELTLNINLLSGTYEFMRMKNECYTGINSNGQIRITLPKENQTTSFLFGESQPLLSTISVENCPQLYDNHLVYKWKTNFLSGLVGLWGSKANIAVVSINDRGTDSNTLDGLRTEASNGLNASAAENIDIDFLIQVLSFNDTYYSIKFLEDYYILGPDQEAMIPIILETLQKYSKTLTNSKSNLGPYSYIKILQQLFPAPKYNESGAVVIMDLAKILYEGMGNYDFQTPAKEILVGMGPDVIPTMVWYLYHYPDQPAVINFASGILAELVKNGYQDEVAIKAGHYLCYLAFQMELGNGGPNHSMPSSVLRRIFPEKSDSYTDPIKYYRWWLSAYGQD